MDWVSREDRSKDGGKVVVTYGRDPAVEALVSDEVVAVDDVLVALSALVEPVKTYTKCVGMDDVPPPP
ncbi:Lipoprotein OS=Streptomyces microflavus OX=1919 GN=Smic_39140 PE=4 SV=1 [Streptomyces microflavus]